MSFPLSSPALTAKIRAPYWTQSGLGPDKDRPDAAADHNYQLKWRNAANDTDIPALRCISDILTTAPGRSAAAYSYGYRVQSYREIPITTCAKAADALFTTKSVHGLSVGQSIEIAHATGSWATLNGTASVKAAASTTSFSIEASSAAYTGEFDGIVMAYDNFFHGTAAQKSYLVQIAGDRAVGYAATGDSNDALLRISGNNWAVNDANFILRGLNISLTNRGLGANVGILENAIGVAGKSGGTTPYLRGLTITCENYGTVSTEFGGLSIDLRNEAAVATTEFGLRLKNTNNSIAGPVATALLVTKSGANTGFTNFASFLDDSMPAVSTCGSVSAIGTHGWIKVLVGSATRYIGLSNTVG